MNRLALVEGRGLALRGDDIDTDRIIPARFLKAITFEGLEAHLFEDERAAVRDHPLNRPEARAARVLVVGRNFGCGSSREHAAQAISRFGIRAIVGESFSEIFFGNALTLGMPCLAVGRGDAARLMDVVEADATATVRVDVGAKSVSCGGLLFAAALPESARDALLTGAWDATGLLRERPEDVDAVAARLPYLRGFAAP